MDYDIWAIPANKALAFNSNIEYSVFEIENLKHFKDKRIVVAKNLIDSITKECEIKSYKKIKTFKSSELKEPYVATHLSKWISTIMFQC